MAFLYSQLQADILTAISDRPQHPDLSPRLLTRRAIRQLPLTPEEAALLQIDLEIEGTVPAYREALQCNPEINGDPLLQRFFDTVWRPEEGVHEAVLGTILEHAIVDETRQSTPIPEADYREQSSHFSHVAGSLGQLVYRRVLPKLGDIPRPRTLPVFASAKLDDFEAAARAAMTGIQMVWGEANEYTAGLGYSLLLRGSEHPVLKRVLPLIKRDEQKHADFYGAVAATRFDAHPAARTVARFAMRHFHRPVGTDVTGSTRFGLQIHHALVMNPRVFDGVARADEQLSERLGQSGLTILANGLLKTLHQYEQWAAANPFFYPSEYASLSDSL